MPNRVRGAYRQSSDASTWFLPLVALLLFWPLLLLAAVLVRYKSPGPVIFRQKRVGRDGVLFTVFKFRTMAIDAQEDGPCSDQTGRPARDPIRRLPAQVQAG